MGLRQYPSGSRYVGQWKEGKIHGIGTMVWCNGNVRILFQYFILPILDWEHTIVELTSKE